MTVWAYARVSTRDQNPQLQLDALAASGYDRLVMEKESGKRGVARPEWEALLALPQPGTPSSSGSPTGGVAGRRTC